LESNKKSLNNAKVDIANIYKLIAERLHKADSGVMKEFLKTVKNSLEIARTDRILEVRSAVKEAIQEWETLKQIYRALKRSKERSSRTGGKVTEAEMLESKEMKELLKGLTNAIQSSPKSKYQRRLHEDLVMKSIAIPEESKENEQLLFNKETYERTLKNKVISKESPRASLYNIIDSEDNSSSDTSSPDINSLTTKITSINKPQTLYAKSRFGRKERGLTNENKDMALLRNPVDFGSKMGKLPSSFWLQSFKEDKEDVKEDDLSQLHEMLQANSLRHSFFTSTPEKILEHIKQSNALTTTFFKWITQTQNNFSQLSKETQNNLLSTLKAIISTEDIIKEAKEVYKKLSNN